MTDEEKWEYLRDIPHTDAKHPRIKHLAEILRVASATPIQTESDKRFAILCMCVARDWIKQTSDVARTGGEDIAGLTRSPTYDDAIEALKRGKDDCDAKARLFVALCLAGGLNAVVMPKWVDNPVSASTPKGRMLQHVYAQVQLDDKWIPAELTLARAKLGELGTNVPKEIKSGKWLLA